MISCWDKMELTEQNFLLFAAKNYDNDQCYDLDEFYSDLTIPIHIKKLFARYKQNGILKERLLLNHVISFYNVFPPLVAAKILFFKIDEKYYSYLKTILYFLNRCPETITIDSTEINIKNIEIDFILLKQLRDST